MNLKNLIPVLGLIFLLFACNQPQGGETETVAHSDVQVTHPVIKDTVLFQEFQGVTQFLQHLQIRSQLTGIISKSFVTVGKRVERGMPLFIVKSREAALINSTSDKSNILSHMADTVFAFSEGIIDQVNVQPGDFIQEGDLIATSVSEASMRIVVSVPLEVDASRFQQMTCKIELPDGRFINGTIGTSLPTASYDDQTNRFLVYPETIAGLAENMHVKIIVKNIEIKNGIFVPKQSLYANEELNKFWVLKVIDDTLAVQLPVNPGVETGFWVQLINPDLKTSDPIIFTGGYALPDSALINITELAN